MHAQDLSPVSAAKGIRQKVARSKFGQLAPVVRRVIVGVIGTTVLLIGVALIVLPGPAFIVIPVGLGILASEFVWARRVMERGKIFVKKVTRTVKRKVEK